MKAKRTKLGKRDVVPQAKVDQRSLDIAASADARERIRQGLDDARNGKGRPAREFFAELEARHGIRR
jgi:hypothetical protein